MASQSESINPVDPTVPRHNLEPLTRAARLDRLPFTRAHRRLLVGSGIGWSLDAMDVGLVSYVMAALAVTWQLPKSDLSLLGSIGFVGMAIGATAGGRLADRFGRRTVFTWTLVIFGVASALMAFANSFEILLALRFVAGLGLGAELPVASTLVSEFSPKRWRGRMVVGLEAFWALGWIAAAMIGFLVVAPFEDGWRLALMIGAVPALYAIIVRLSLPESVRFLEGADRIDEAERAVRVFEESAGVAATPSPPATPSPTGRFSELFKDGRARATLALFAVWFFVNFSYYGAFIWLPTLLVGAGNSLSKSLGYTLIIALAQLPGYALAAYLIEKIGRRYTLAILLMMSAGAAIGFSTATTSAAIIGFGMLLSASNLGAWGALYAVTPEVFPTRLRGTGAGAAAGFGRIASIIAPLLVPVLLQAFGATGPIFAVFAAAFILAAGAALLLPELRGKALED